jgi:hypothetical protein
VRGAPIRRRVLAALSLACVTAFVLMGSAVGVRMLLLARRTGGTPERLMGLGFVLVCAVGYPMSFASGFGRGSVAEMRLPIWVVATLITQAGIGSIWLFTAEVFRPGVTWARLLTAAGIGALAVSFAGSVYAFATAPPEAGSIAVARPWLLVGMVGYAGSFFWSAIEGLRHHRMAVRRLALGLADPVVANRFLLWALYGLMASGICVASSIGTFLELDPTASPAILLPMGVLGAGASAAMYLAFAPPAWYLARVRARSTQV